MKVNVLAFGIVKDIFGKSSIQIEAPDLTEVRSLKKLLENGFPELKKLKSYFIAINNEYAEDLQLINKEQEIAVIPPVSGG